MEHVLAESSLFDPFPAHVVTMQQVVTRTKRVLKYEMLPIVEAEIAHSSAREDLRRLQLAVSAALTHLVAFLYNVFRNGGGPTKVSLSSLKMPVGEKLEKILKNRTGYLLHRLVTSGLFTSVFLDDHFQLEDERKAVAEGMLKRRTEVVQSNDFLDPRGNVRIPKWLLEFEPDPKERAAIDLTNVFDHDDSGMEPAFRGKAMVTGCYLRCYGLAQELAKFILVVEKAHRLAGQGGDLLVYGVTNAQVNAMLQTYEALSRSVRQQVARLTQIAEIRFEELVNDNQARDSANKWVRHFKKVSFSVELLEDDLSRADDAALHVRAQANAMTLQQRLAKAKEDTDNFIAQADGYSRHVAGVLGIDYQPVMVPAISTMENALTLPDMPMGRLAIMASSAMQPSNNMPSFAQSQPLMIEGVPRNPLAQFKLGSSLNGNPEQLADQSEELLMIKQGITDTNLNRVLIRLTPSIVHVSLENNRLTGSGALALFEHVAKYCPNVKSINLYHNNLGPEGARALAAALTRPDHSLTKLDLNSNDIGDEGAQYIIGGLLANRSLTELDLGYNGITDRGIEDLREAVAAEDGVLKFLKLSGNQFTAASLVPILEIFERNNQFVQIDIGDPTDKVPPHLADKFKQISHPRLHAWNSALQAKYEAERVKSAEPKLKRIEASSGAPILKQKAPKQPVMVAASSSSVPGFVSRALPSVARMLSGPTIEELPDTPSPSPSPSPYQEVYEEEPDVELKVEDYYPLIRVLQLLIPRCKTKEFGAITKKYLRKAFDCAIYDTKLPDITMTIEEYYDAARAAGVVEIREIKKKGSSTKIGIALTDQWRNYVVPHPAKVAKVTPKSWNTFIQCCKLKPNAQHKKSSLSRWARTIKPDLQSESDDVITAIVELAVYSGTVAMDLHSGKYMPNLTQKRYPIDLSVCPKFDL